MGGMNDERRNRRENADARLQKQYNNPDAFESLFKPLSVSPMLYFQMSLSSLPIAALARIDTMTSDAGNTSSRAPTRARTNALSAFLSPRSCHSRESVISRSAQARCVVGRNWQVSALTVIEKGKVQNWIHRRGLGRICRRGITGAASFPKGE